VSTLTKTINSEKDRLTIMACPTIEGVTVPYKGVGCCLGPEGNGVSPGEGGKGGPDPLTRSKISSLDPARKEATWSRRKKERKARRDNEVPACTE
jgi:hypothetical protein